MSRSTVELDFFQMEKQSTPKSTAQNKLLNRRRSFRDIQGVISKLNPELLRTVIESGSVNQSLMGKSSDNQGVLSNMSFSVPSSPKDHQTSFPPLPVYTPTFRPNSCSESAPLTIFYNGTVSVFDVSRKKAENILKLAEKGVQKAVESSDQQQLPETLNNGDLPIARKKSLQSFLQKRKERLTLASPYGSPTDCILGPQYCRN